MRDGAYESSEAPVPVSGVARRRGDDARSGGIKVVFTDLDGTIVHYAGPRPCRAAAPHEVGDVEDVEDVEDVGDSDYLDLELAVELWNNSSREVEQERRIGLNEAWVDFRRKTVGHTMGKPVKRYRRQLVELPESTSGSVGYISLRTLELFEAIRAMGVKVVVISGCRYRTLMERLPFIPKADAYVCESGGRIFYNKQLDGVLCEDLGWKAKMKTGLSELKHCNTCIQNRMESHPTAIHLKVDDRSYTTAFRVRQNPSAPLPRALTLRNCVEGILERGGFNPHLSMAVNLGCVDVYPKSSGKKNAATYVADKLGGWTLGEHAAFFCDDDNDIELAQAVKRVYLPGVSDELWNTVAGDTLNVGRPVHEKYRFMHDPEFHWYGEPFSHTESLLDWLRVELQAQEEDKVAMYCEQCGQLAYLDDELAGCQQQQRQHQRQHQRQDQDRLCPACRDSPDLEASTVWQPYISRPSTQAASQGACPNDRSNENMVC